MATNETHTTTAKRLRHGELKVGEYLSSTMYMRVTGVSTRGIDVKRLKQDGEEQLTWTGVDLVEKECVSAAQFSKEEKVTKSELAEHLTRAGHHVFTVAFEKQDGTERTLVGHYVRTEPLLGRSYVVDLETPKRELRLVDHRAVHWLILNGTKYVAK